METDFRDILYSQKILARGLRYFRENRVMHVKIKNHFVRAIVLGTKKYHVKLEIASRMLVHAECDCPYYYENGACKHIAAVLFYLVQNKIPASKSNIKATGASDKLNQQ